MAPSLRRQFGTANVAAVDKAGKEVTMSPFTFFSTVGRKPFFRWLVIAILLAGLLIITTRAWSAPALPLTPSASTATDAGVAVSTEPQKPAASTAPRAVDLLSITAVPEAITIAQGAGGALSIDLASRTPASPAPLKDIVFTATGLPAGVTASFTPIDTAGRGNVILSAAKTSPAGPVTFTLTAKQGASTVSKQLTLTVIKSTDPDFTAAVLPGKLDVNQGSDGYCQLTLTPMNGFSSPVKLTAEGTPPGVTADVESSPDGLTSTLHMVATDSTPISSTPITIVATDGKITHTAHVLLAVDKHPDFALQAWTSDISMTALSTASDTLTIAPVNGFTSAVKLSLLDLPPGISARFSPAVAKTGNSTLILSADSSVKPGSVRLTVQATSGSTTHRDQFVLNVVDPNQPSFALTAWPGDANLIPGGRAANTITVVRNNGFKDTVSLTATGMPAGVTAEFSPPSTKGTSTLTLVADPKLSLLVPVSIKVTGVSGGVSHTTTLTLNVMTRDAAE